MSKQRKTRRQGEQDAPVSASPPPAVVIARSNSQVEALEKSKSNDIMFLVGPAGSGKTWVAMKIAWEMLKFGKAESIIITRPIVPCGGKDKLGFQPGDLKAKFMNYVMPFRDVLNDIVGVKASPQVLDSFEWLPLDFVRGRTLKNCVAIMDEAQNAEEDELRAFLTRIGENGKLILCGHPKQCDLRCGGQHFLDIASDLEKAKSAAVVHFSESVNMRHPLIPKIEKVFDARADKRRKQMQQ